MKKTNTYNRLLKYIALCASMYFYLFPVIPVIAQVNRSSDSLTVYLEMATRNNPGVMQKWTEYQAAIQKVPQVGSLPDPEFSLGVFLSPMELVSGNQIADIRLMQMFPWFGVLKNAKDEMSLMAKAKYEVFRAAKWQVYYEVQRTWYELYKVRQNIRISENNIEILRSIERLTLNKFSAGPSGGSSSSSSAGLSGGLPNGPSGASQSVSSGAQGMQTMGGAAGSNSVSPSSPAMQSSPMGSSSGGFGLADVYRVQMELGELENSIALLKNQQNTVVAKFNSLLSRPPQTPVSVPDTLNPDVQGLSLATVADSILAHNPMLGMLRYEKQSLEARREMVSRMGYPMVGVGLNYSLISKSDMSSSSMNGKDMIMPMVTVTLPVYRKKYHAMQAEAGLMKTATEQGFQAAANDLQAEYYEALQLYQDAQQRMNLYENQRQLAQKSLDIMIKSFSASSSGLTDILRIRQQLLDYEFKKVEAVVDFNTSVAWLKKLGSISKKEQS